MIEGMSSNMTAFIVTSILLGAGLAMDAFAVSMANGLVEKDMAFRRRCFIAGIYGAFQFAMPLIGWFFVHGLVEWFESFRKLVPWIALVLLLFIGGKMFYEGYTGEGEAVSAERLTLRILILQGVATSLDALSVGFMLADYSASFVLRDHRGRDIFHMPCRASDRKIPGDEVLGESTDDRWEYSHHHRDRNLYSGTLTDTPLDTPRAEFIIEYRI